MSPSLEIPEELRDTDWELRQAGVCPEDIAGSLLKDINVIELNSFKKRFGWQSDKLERLLIYYAALHSRPRVSSLSIERSVCLRLEQDLQSLHTSKASLEAGSYHFNRAAKIATLRRFPAGPMEWEISGVPRSYFLQAGFPEGLRLFAFVMFRLRARVPCFFMHVAPSPRNRALTVPREVLRAYYRIAKSLQLQPEMRALLAHAWFHDPAAVRDHPQLEILSRPYLEHGGRITLLGPAPLSSGVLEGNAQRSADYLSGKVRYRYGFAVWPRDAAISWAVAHPELADQ